MAKNKKKKKLWVKILIAFLVILLLLMLTVAAAVSYVLGKIGSALPSDPIEVIPPEFEYFETDPTEPPAPTTAPITEPTLSTDATGATDATTEPTTEPTVPPTTVPDIDWPTMEEFVDDQIINILLIGQDANVAAGRSRSDTMIMLSINKRNNTISLTSFMRDLYVDFPGDYSDNRINAAYLFGGAPLLNETLKLNFGVNIDGNVAVGFDQFQKIIEILGGVDVYINEYEAQYMRDTLKISQIQEGVNHLNGYQALSFCRIRKIDSDHNRTERQRRVLTAIAESARSASMGTLLDMINEVLPYVSTDLSDSQIVSYSTDAIRILLGGGSIRSGKVPQSGDYTAELIRGMQVMVPNLWRCYDYIKEFIYS